MRETLLELDAHGKILQMRFDRITCTVAESRQKRKHRRLLQDTFEELPAVEEHEDILLTLRQADGCDAFALEACRIRFKKRIEILEAALLERNKARRLDPRERRRTVEAEHTLETILTQNHHLQQCMYRIAHMVMIFNT